ncbi:MAG TPA: FtsX-like permease family protein, partial [Candidatus Aquilonibacter sp.]
AAALIVRSFVTLTHVPLGFSAEHVYFVEAPELLASRYKGPRSEEQVDRALQGAMRSIPGMRTTSCATTVPFTPPWTTSFNVVSQPQKHVVAVKIVCDGYFALLQVPFLAGRNFGAEDSMGSPAVVLVNRAFATRYGGSPANVIGKRIVPGIGLGDGQPPPRTIVGVVGDTRDDLSTPPVPTVYAPQSQFDFKLIQYYVIGTGGADAGLAQAIANAYHDTDPFFASPVVVPLSDNIAASAASARLATSVFLAFSVIALVLALAGIYSVTAFSVAQRTREFGIRKAIGATSTAVLRIVVQRALRQATIGIVLGLVLSAFAVRFLTTILYATSPFDAVAIASAVAILLACTLVAAAVPAIAAMRIEPAETLRYE